MNQKRFDPYKIEKVAVIDLGSARTKVAILTSSLTKLLKLKDETGLSNHLSKEGYLDTNFIEKSLLPKLLEYKELIMSNGCERFLTIGTHIFRTAINSADVRSIIEPFIGPLNIIDGWVEGALFYSCMSKTSKTQNIGTIDLGGGSVQIAFGGTQEKVFTLPTGTFSLEKKFQKSKDYASANELASMESFIYSCLESTNIKEFNIEAFVAGSNCIEDFVKSAYMELHNLNDQVLEWSQSHISLAQIEFLYNAIKEKRYSEISNYYPQNKFFMYGADKALLNLITICKYCNVKDIIPTNDSLSSAIINLLSINPEKLTQYNIKYVDLGN